MFKNFLSILPALSMLLSAPQFVSAAEVTPSAPVNVIVPAASTTYSSISIIWDKPEDYKQITGYKVYIDGNPQAVTAANETYYTADN
ncbi:MAG: fibronectin type III domain-containing protein, partial [Clostridia bacterium]